MSKTDWLLAAPTSATNSKADTPLHPFLVRLMRGENLSMDEASEFFNALTDESAARRCHFNKKEMSFFELLLYNMRHVQEHAAQMNLFLGQKGISVVSWVSKAKDSAA